MITIEGSLERIRFRNEVSCYSVADLRTAGHKNLITLVGVMPSAAPGQTVRVTGDWVAHPRYGQQLKITAYEIVLPATTDGINRYLKSGLIRGLGPAMADRITAHFGTDSLHVIEREPERLTEVPGIGQARVAMIRAAWLEHHAVRELMDFLREKGVDIAYSARIFRQYGPESLNVLRTDPFRLVEDIPVAGFVIADAIALSTGAAADDPRRIRACLSHLLARQVSAGHVFAFERQLLEQCESVFQIDPSLAETALAGMAAGGQVVLEAMPGPDPDINLVFPARLHEAETMTAARLLALLAAPVEDADAAGSEDLIDQVVSRLAIKPSSEQLNVLENVFRHRVVVITGGPGTGKTTLVRAITTVLEGSGRTVILAAPTGRAAKRLAEVSHHDAATIHKLLGYNLEDESFIRNRDNPLQADAVIVDEASMVDIQLFYHLLSAIPVSSVLVLVGDVFQLPSVGPGNVLADLIRSEMLPVFLLTEIFRQARQSAIVTNAHRVRNGQPPDLETARRRPPDEDFWFVEESDPEAIAGRIVELCGQTLPGMFGLDPLTGIQVLTPMHKGPAGTINLNQKLQAALNSAPAAGVAGSTGFKPGDKVIHLRNNYQKEVFNGDIGTVAAVDPMRQVLTVDYDGRLVDYDFSETDELTLAYAITVHKSQGSEYPAVIVPLITQHYTMLERNLLYTAMTRARRLLVLIGTTKAVQVAMSRNDPHRRLSLLAARLNPDLE
ncbi:MAG: ATP-dependent RecD-like DNA helicase [Thermodesulfobacteriota bacterium]